MASNTIKYRFGFLAIPIALGLTGLAIASEGSTPSLDELLGIVRSSYPPVTQPSQEDDPTQTSSIREDEATVEAGILKQLGDRPPADVLGQAVKQMDHVADRIAENHDVGLATQRLQESIMAKLDQVIEAAKKLALSNSSSGSGSPDGQAQQQEGGGAMNAAQQDDATDSGSLSSSASSSANNGEPHAANTNQQPSMQDNQDRWGNLPLRLRKDLLQGINERFSSVYQELTGQYYRRLSQEDQP